MNSTKILLLVRLPTKVCQLCLQPNIQNTSKLTGRQLHGLSSVLNLGPQKHRSLLCKASSTYEAASVEKEEGLIKRTLQKWNIFGIQNARNTAIGYNLYETLVNNVDYMEFFMKFNLPDTFYSWFVITELHIWMLAVRAMAEGTDGRHVRNAMVEALWIDVAKRVKKLGAVNPAGTKGQISNLSEQLQAALIAYDEGLQTNDTVLAGALWRRFFQQEYTDPEHLDDLVKYIRKQMRLLDSLPKEKLFSVDSVDWNVINVKV